MRPTHHLDILIRSAHIDRELHARLLLLTHRMLAHGEHTLAVAWPDWGDAPGEFGLLFRLFGEEAGLALFDGQLDGLRERKLIRSYPVAAVPASASTVAYLRHRTIEKHTPGFAARQARRNERLGAPKPSRQPQAINCHSLEMQSVSTGRSYALFLKRDVAAPEGAGGRQYGLGLTLPDF